jgi:hypothetical protein
MHQSCDIYASKHICFTAVEQIEKRRMTEQKDEVPDAGLYCAN